MKKHIKDYLHLYLGCKIIGSTSDNEGSVGYLTGITNGGTECEIQWILEDGINVSETPDWNDVTDVKPILRPWSNLQIDEVKDVLTWPTDCCFKRNKKGEILYIGTQPLTFRANEYKYLLSIGIDLFGLIEDGLAIDATAINPTTKTTEK